MVTEAMVAGNPPLTARVEPWMKRLIGKPRECAQLIERYGSPVNVHNFEPLVRNINELREVATAHSVKFGVYLARKANKTFGVVKAAANAGAGIDVASQRELEQCLELGVPGPRMIFSAATKTAQSIDRALDAVVTISVDNLDELQLIIERGRRRGAEPQIALRLAIDDPAIAPSRFGLTIDQWMHRVRPASEKDAFRIRGLHFHLNGYSAAERAIALKQAVQCVDELRGLGHRPEFIDMGGGIPMNYLESAEQWRAFWRAVAATDPTDRPTWRGDQLGLTDPEAPRPSAATYPYFQEVTRGEWLDEILKTPVTGLDGSGERTTVAEELRNRNLELRCEPGRALLDGCGMTLASVAFRKETSDGLPLVGLYMNRTQVRSTSADFLVDPFLARASDPDDLEHNERDEPLESAFLVGSYCIEEELLLRRSLTFPNGVDVGDIVIFPNTGGYLMHIVESASHQLPLAANLVWDQRLAEDNSETPAQETAPLSWIQDGVDAINPAGGSRIGATTP